MSGRKRSAPGLQKAGKKIRVGATVRVKAEPDNPTSVTTSIGKVSKASVKEQFIALLSEPRYKTGAPNKVIQEKFSNDDEQKYLVEAINELSRESRLHMSKSGVDSELFYTLVADEVAQKYQGLDVSDRLVLQVIEKAGNKGIWTKEIRIQTNIHPQPLNKIFKHLEQRRLIKPVKSVTAKAKKLYMLYELSPSKEITGGVWYSGLEFDHEFISELRTFVIQCVKKLNEGKGVTLAEIKGKMKQIEVSKVELSLEEIQQLVQTLAYDHLIEEGSVTANGENRYVAARRISTMCEFKWWDALSPDFHFREIRFEDGVTLGPHELHHHTA
jgi:DNA-directed RNA polymerase III subunit RPC6